MKDRPKISQVVELTLDQHGPGEAICIIENEAARMKKNSGTADEIYEASDQIISDADISLALTISSDQLLHLHRMMLHAPNLEPEEWVLAITILSSYYCTHIFASRRGFAVREDELANATELLRECTSDFRDKRFARALASARRHNPNPLPSPL